ncbi:MAG TPA: hypothetical protein VIJ07_18225 [Dermatophilaceae bacterium]
MGLAVDFGEGTIDARPFERCLFAPLDPRDAGDALNRLLEGVILIAVVELALEASDVALVAVVP